MLSIISNKIVVQKGLIHFLFTSLMAALLTVATCCWLKQSLPFYLSHPMQLSGEGKSTRERNTHPASADSLSPLMPCAENHGGPQNALSEPSRVFKGSDENQEIDGIIELFVLKGNTSSMGASENRWLCAKALCVPQDVQRMSPL